MNIPDEIKDMIEELIVYDRMNSSDESGLEYAYDYLYWDENIEESEEETSITIYL